ncbi:MAG: hypothetical protein AVDCRST_MAG93-2743 [uncultured Chloroflexia bacterium]|uniref:Uncharacterized protein n=1 Tax=uncultured Chloroflexia bacterium TaxID=1672391 RepID=A0A6J4JDA6_9CHLR|nr:MAG: hypothetical protein AVDCRST_MAG93-2743 [uncultured Chloroflexia bacterium]
MVGMCKSLQRQGLAAGEGLEWLFQWHPPKVNNFIVCHPYQRFFDETNVAEMKPVIWGAFE